MLTSAPPPQSFPDPTAPSATATPPTIFYPCPESTYSLYNGKFFSRIQVKASAEALKAANDAEPHRHHATLSDNSFFLQHGNVLFIFDIDEADHRYHIKALRRKLEASGLQEDPDHSCFNQKMWDSAGFLINTLPVRSVVVEDKDFMGFKPVVPPPEVKGGNGTSGSGLMFCLRRFLVLDAHHLLATA